MSIAFIACSVDPAFASYSVGASNNFEFDQPASYWTSAVRGCGGSVLDLVVAQAQDGYAALPFPFQGTGAINGVSDVDLAEPYLEACDREGIGVILSLQPWNADVTDVIGIILSRYGHHRCVIGINVDLEWKNTGTPLHASNRERDTWTAEISRFNPGLKLFLTYYKDYTYFPDDDGKMVVLYDGLGDTQENILKAYGELAKHFANVGIYTGYQSSCPPAASDEMILDAAPNTRYVIHTDDLKGNAGAAIQATEDSQPEGSGLGGMTSRFSMPVTGSSVSGLRSNGFSMPSVSSGINCSLPGFSGSAVDESASGHTESPASPGAGNNGFEMSSRIPDIGGIVSRAFHREQIS